MKIEISRKKLAMPVAAFATGLVKGFKESMPIVGGAVVTAIMWKAGCKKTAAFYAALTAGTAARMVIGYEHDEQGDEAFYDALHDKIAGPEKEETEAEAK